MTDPLATLPWERQPRETPKAWRAFCAYRDLGATRTVLAAYRLVTGHRDARNIPGWWSKWSSQNDWVERAAAYDQHKERLEREERERTWRERSAQVADLEWDTAQQLLGRAKEILSFPLVTTETSKDGKTIIIRPQRWTAADARGYAELATRLMRLSTGKPTDRQELTGADGRGLLEPSINLEGLTDDEIATLLALLDKASRQTERPTVEAGQGSGAN